MIRLFTSPSGHARREAAARFVQSFPVGTEILLVGGTRESVDDMARQIAREHGATFGLHRFSVMQLASRLAMGSLATRGLAPGTPLGTEAAAARAAHAALEAEDVERLRPVVGFPGFPRALAATLTELRQAGLNAAGSVGGEAELSSLLSHYERALEHGSIADRTRLLDLARGEIAESGGASLRGAPLLLLDPAVATSAERHFLKALAAACGDVLATVPAGDLDSLRSLQAIGAKPVAEDDDEAGAEDVGGGNGLRRLQEFLFSDEAPPAEEIDEHVRFFSAPGEGRECVEIARQILQAAGEGVPLDRIAVFVRAAEVYAVHLETAFRRASIPVYFSRGTRRPDPSGRAFLSILACKSERLSAKRFAEYLSFAQIPEPDASGAPRAREVWTPPEEESLGPAGDPVQLAFGFMEGRDVSAETPAPGSGAGADPPREPSTPDTDEAPALEGSLRSPWRWEEFLVEAAVIGGKDRWRRRLRGLEKEYAIKLEETIADDPDAPRASALQRDIGNLGHLERFALPVIEALDDLPDRATWGGWLDALSRLAPMVLRRPERVLTILAEMRPMGAIGPVGLEEVRTVLAPRLSQLEGVRPPHRYGRVFVGTPEQARGQSFRLVFVPGLAERVFPQRPREDPLLLDAARREVSPELRTQEDRGRSERLLLRLAVGAAEQRVVLSYPRIDVVQARPRVPSFYGLDIHRATRGAVPDHELMEREAAAEVGARLAWPSPEDPDAAIDAVEHDLSVLEPLLRRASRKESAGRARYLLDLNPHLARSLRSRWSRWSRKWTAFDGLIRTNDETKPILDAQRPKARPFSATALQKFSVCPYQFFLYAIHRLGPREDAVPLIRMDPLTRGSMLHEILAVTLRTLRDGDALPLTPKGLPDAIRVLDDAVSEISARYAEDLAPAIPRIWEDEVKAIRADLRYWIRQTLLPSAWIPKHFELRFGLPFEEPYDPLSQKDPVSLEGGWRLRGAVDLIEEENGGQRLRVTDHKSGVNRTKRGTVVGGGEILQPVLYSLAVEAKMEREVAEGRLDFCTARGGFSERVVPMDKHARRYAQEVLGAIDRSIENGVLPPMPKERACTWCDFRSVCGPREERRTGRKRRELLAELEKVRMLP